MSLHISRSVFDSIELYWECKRDMECSMWDKQSAFFIFFF